jgi:hypothetical protein
VRHARMLGLALAALLALGAIAASSAMAKKETEIQQFEKLFGECAIGYSSPEAPEVDGCNYGEAGKESYFQAGKVTVYFKKPVSLHSAYYENESGEFFVIPARNGQTVSKEAEPGPSLTEGVEASLLEEPEKARYEEYLASGKSTKTTETVELAAPASDIYLNEGNLLQEEGITFEFPVEIHISNPFLGHNCYVGSWAEPIRVAFTDGTTAPPEPNQPIHGHLGRISTIDEGEVLKIGNPKEHIEERGHGPEVLVNNSFASPGVHGCGMNGGADAALDGGLGLPSPAGTNASALIGTLYQTGRAQVEERLPYLLPEA